MNVQEFLSYLNGVKRCNDYYIAKCPAHDDKKQSLSIREGDGGKVLVNCHAGCQTEDIVASLSLTVKDLFNDMPKAKKQIVAVYNYGDCQKVRYSDKSFTWKRPDGKGGWIFNRQGVPHKLYGKVSQAVCVCEGEKDAGNLCKIGFNAVSGEDGAGKGKWLAEYTQQLKGCDVCIFQDNDKIGKEYAQEVAAALTDNAKSVRLIDLTKVWADMPDKADVSDFIEKYGAKKACELITGLISVTPEWATHSERVKAATSFGEDNTRFLWYPYLPIGEYSVMMADGGTGKTLLCCGIAAAVSKGENLPGDDRQQTPKNVLIISGEDRGEMLRKRLVKSGADLEKVFIIDCMDSVGMDFNANKAEFEQCIRSCKPSLVIVDPWHNFLGTEVNINQVNELRPVLQGVANMAKRNNCAFILISHVNKRAQGENANNAATGSTDFVNAARSAVRVIFDEEDKDGRVMVHTKSNYAPYGESVKYRISDGGVSWNGFSSITRETLESAARRKSTPFSVLQTDQEREEDNAQLIEALKEEANPFKPTRISYDDFKTKYGDSIFGGRQPKRALDSLIGRLSEDGYFLKTGVLVFRNKKQSNGFAIQYIETAPPQQMQI